MADTDSRFPLVYESSLFIKGLVVVATLAIGGFFVFGDPITWGIHNEYGGLIMLAIGLLGGDFVLTTLRQRVRLYPDRFECRWELGEFSGLRSEIRGYRVVRSRYSGSRLIFCLKFPDNRSFTLNDNLSNPFIKGWVGDIPDLDQQEREAYQAALLENPVFGPDRAKRDKTITQHKTVLTVLNAAGCVIAACLYFFPGRETLAACMLFPVAMLGLAAFSGGRYAVMWDYNNPKLKLTFAFFVPAIVLGFRTFLDDTLIDKTPAILPSLSVALVLILLVILIDQRPQTRILAISAIALAVGSWGGLLSYDRLLDTSTAVIYPTLITSKEIHHGSKGGVYYELEVSPINVSGIPSELDTNANFYAQAYPGQPLCINLHKGALGYRWFDFGPCASSTPSPH